MKYEFAILLNFLDLREPITLIYLKMMKAFFYSNSASFVCDFQCKSLIINLFPKLDFFHFIQVPFISITFFIFLFVEICFNILSKRKNWVL